MPSGSSEQYLPAPPEVPSGSSTAVIVIYVLSGVSQPLLVTLAKSAGLADPTCQLYMLPYYLGPALLNLQFLFPRSSFRIRDYSRETIVKTAGVATVDIASQVMNYTGASMCGPTIFAIIYASVTVWAAVLSILILSRYMTAAQWTGVMVVFGGLTITALDSMSVGPNVFRGSCLVLIGSLLHALVYVLSEVLLTTGEKLPVTAYCAVLCAISSSAFILWQLVYTFPRFDDLIGDPMRAAGTSPLAAFMILCAIGLANLVHALSFFHTLKNTPGGSVSAGILKGLAAVLVFVACHWAFCGSHFGGDEMCFTWSKFAALVVVVGGVLFYARATESAEHGNFRQSDEGYEGIQDAVDIELLYS
mmetsp:Transcript_33079/g.98403  ORF Transcript_33079/g.98403 Transcript_33079/m.98403 type:complete len:361 (-) Transcript_33079:256-1338(-)